MEFVGDTCRGFPRGIAKPTYHQAQGIASPRGRKLRGRLRWSYSFWCITEQDGSWLHEPPLHLDRHASR